MSTNYDRLQEVYKDNMHLFYTNTDSFQLLIKNINPYILDEKVLNCCDFSNFKPSTIFPLRPGMNEKVRGRLEFENGENPAKEFDAKAPKTYEDIFSNKKIYSKSKRLKKGYKKNINLDDFEMATMSQIPIKVTQKQIKSKKLNMTMEDVEKDVIPILSK